jgi:hypothetical protein
MTLPRIFSQVSESSRQLQNQEGNTDTHNTGIAIQDVQELSCVITEPARKTVWVPFGGAADLTDSDHDIAEITLQSADSADGERYILDLTSAQFGFFKPIVPSCEYFDGRTRIGFVDDNMAFGVSKRWAEAQMRSPSPSCSTIYTTNVQASRALFNGARAWELQSNLEVKDLLKMPAEVFESKVEELLTFVGLCLHFHLDRLLAAQPGPFRRLIAEEGMDSEWLDEEEE